MGKRKYIGYGIIKDMQVHLNDTIAKLVIYCYNVGRETKEPGGLPSYFGGASPPDERKEGVANVCYIF